MNRMKQGNPVVSHYKMFKSGKRWVYAGITLASLGTSLMLTTNAHADQTATTSAIQATAVATQSTTESTDNQAVAPAENTADQTPTTAATTTFSAADVQSNDASSVTKDDAQDQSKTAEDQTPATDAQKESATDQVKNDADSNVKNDTQDDVKADDAKTDSAAKTENKATTPVTETTTADTKLAAAETTPATTTADSGHGPVYTTDDTKLDNDTKITIEKTGPYAITWKKVSTTTKTETETVTLDASDIVAAVKAIEDATGTSTQIAAAKAQFNDVLAKLKEIPGNLASQLVGNALYQMIFTGTGSNALSNFRTMLDPTRYDISGTWTGLDPVAYAADKAAAETYYPAAVTWYNNATKETWTLPEYNDPTQNVRATYIQNGDSTKTVVIGQGWTQRPDWIGYVSKIWYDMGYNILMPSQRGQFLSDGNDMTFGYQDKYDWLNWVKMVDARNGEDSQVVFYGQSLGADTVIEAASVPGLSKSVKAVVADAGYSTLPELGSSLYNKAVATVSSKLVSLGLPAITSLPFLSYDNVLNVINNRLEKQQGFGLNDVSGVDAASKVTVPLMLIHTEDDAFIPYTQSLELAAANNSKIQTVWLLPGNVGGHASANNAVLQYTQHIKDFLAEAMPVDVDQTTDPDTDNNGSTDVTDPDNGNDNGSTDVTDPDNGNDNGSTDVTDPDNGNDNGSTDVTDTDNGKGDGSAIADPDTAVSGGTHEISDDQAVNVDDPETTVNTTNAHHSDSTVAAATNVTTASTKVQTTAHQAVQPAAAQAQATSLPQTGDEAQEILSVLGVSVAAMTTGLYVGTRRRQTR